VNHLRGHLLVDHPNAITEAELSEWLTKPGIPASAVAARSERLAAVDEARRRFLSGEVAAEAMKDGEWNTQEWLHFLNGLPETTTREQLAALDAAFKLTAASNSEIAFRWYLAGIRAGYAPVFEPLERFLVTVGRRKFVKPLFEALWAVPERRAFATRVYAKARPRYHPVTQAAIDAIVQGSG
jgi:hypothetical protein